MKQDMIQTNNSQASFDPSKIKMQSARKIKKEKERKKERKERKGERER
jgi:hypothetical protein